MAVEGAFRLPPLPSSYFVRLAGAEEHVCGNSGMTIGAASVE